MSKYFIQYHKAEEFGLPFTEEQKIENVSFEKGLRNDLRFFTTKKNIEKEIGNFCFLIVGVGIKGKMDFYLWSFIQIENVIQENSKLYGCGSGFNFSSPIRLNDWENFQELKSYSGHFGLGFKEITSLNFCQTLESVVNDYYKELITIIDTDNKITEITKVRKLSKSDRAKVLNRSNPKPEKQTISLTVFKRNIYVIAEVLERANGKCERCEKSAPFFRDKDNTEYLEVHHIIPLSENGDDTVENAIALCPNCHRHAHYGKSTY